jgi:precorrin isomerase
MRRLHSFAALLPAERALALRAVITALAVRVALWLLPFRVVHRALQRALDRRAPVSVDAAAVSRAVARAARTVPGATCLVQAVTGAILLSRGGRPATVVIGVAGGAGFEAHAWLESDGMPVAGVSEAERFAPLLRIASPRA